MNRILLIPESIYLGICLLLSTGALAAENQCIDCHQNAAFYVEYPKLYEYFQEWQVSPHQLAGVTCDDCHGGDANAETSDDAHVGVLAMNDAQSTLHYQNQPQTCGQCHSENRAQFTQSKHYEALMGQRAAPTCTSCHPAMSRRPEYRVIVLNACRNCHGPGNSENLPVITDQAENVFHQLNIAGGFLGWTQIHFESQGWPDDSRERVRDLDMRYRATLNQVHQFDLEQTDDATNTMLRELREIFDAARQAHEQQRE